MKEVDYIPKGELADIFEGVIKIKLPRYRERLKLVREAGLKPSEDGSLKADADSLLLMDKMLEAVEKNIVSMDIKHIESGEKFSSLEDLEIYEEGIKLIADLGNVLLSGIRLGKN